MDERAESISAKKIMSPCDVEALKKCLEENNGDYVKCQSQIEAFKSSCSLKKPNPSQESEPQLKTCEVLWCVGGLNHVQSCFPFLHDSLLDIPFLQGSHDLMIMRLAFHRLIP
ncbi:uncharacterized protein LOC132167346 isoform X1 [Corylus avellana]|uniref:uncharacterized protein LOC132167346 isoform X1 n=1 Tax=Corylus avellana TaxID=13451 RepID=UPI00286C38A8|nr:uncharacterized protein LOC132167346 isoform X1 [Corylus avellana]